MLLLSIHTGSIFSCSVVGSNETMGKNQTHAHLRRRTVSLTARFPVSSHSRPSPDRGDPGCRCRRPSQRSEGQRGGPTHADSTGRRTLQHRPRPGVEGGDGHPAQQQPQGESDAPGVDHQTSFQLVFTNVKFEQIFKCSKSAAERRELCTLLKCQ